MLSYSLTEVRTHVFGSFARPSLETTVTLAPDLSIDEAADEQPDFEAVRATAWAEGFQQGYDEGLRLAQEERKEETRKLARLVLNALVDTKRSTRALEQQVVELSLAIASKVVEREVSIDPGVVLSVVRAALREVQDATSLYLIVNPQDYDSVSQHWESMLRKPLAQRSHLIADERVQPGGCIVETQVGHVDAQLTTKLSQVTNTFQALLEGEPV
ncbi:MAG: hypothetical protein HY329_01865 [Chloroflexi bacterium]|nr:hypothetical protein [Chloroflexota bacterium]